MGFAFWRHHCLTKEFIICFTSSYQGTTFIFLQNCLLNFPTTFIFPLTLFIRTAKMLFWHLEHSISGIKFYLVCIASETLWYLFSSPDIFEVQIRDIQFRELNFRDWNIDKSFYFRRPSHLHNDAPTISKDIKRYPRQNCTHRCIIRVGRIQIYIWAFKAVSYNLS